MCVQLGLDTDPAWGWLGTVGLMSSADRGSGCDPGPATEKENGTKTGPEGTAFFFFNASK